MTFTKAILAVAFLLSGGVGVACAMSSAQAPRVAQIAQGAPEAQGAQQAPEANVTQLMSKDLTDIPGKEGLMLTVEYPPGGSSPIHRHNAHAFVYVLEGSIVMQLRGGIESVLTPGQTFYEGPDDVHLVSRNASQTEPAKFVVFLVKDTGAPVQVSAS
jgi:quercetin dioxygenase-like cupin family protein